MTDDETRMILKNQGLILATLAYLVEISGKVEVSRNLSREAEAILDYVNFFEERADRMRTESEKR